MRSGMKTLWTYLRQIVLHQSVIRLMALQEIHARFVGTFAGFTWSLLSPLLMILVYWFVFSVGFKVQPVGDIPFVLMYVCGMMPFMMFTETLSNSADAIVKNVHLVKKTVFPTEILPAVQLLASLVGHGIMLAILVGLMAFYRVGFSLYNAQSLYYLFALSVLCLGLSWFLASVNVFCRDLSHILKVVLNVWFWATPIVWPLEIMPERYRPFLKLNPLYYIVEGYRGSLLYHVPLWQDYYSGLYFWTLCLALLVGGGIVFRKLKPGFGDVL
jgi:ABC-type polysaccharide/polyol phosphate export permease